MESKQLAEKMFDEVREQIPYDGPSLEAYTLSLCRYFLSEIFPHIKDVEKLKDELSKL